MFKFFQLIIIYFIFQTESLLAEAKRKTIIDFSVTHSEYSHVLVKSVKTKKYFLVFSQPFQTVLEVELSSVLQAENRLLLLVKKVTVSNYKKTFFKSAEEIEGRIISINGNHSSIVQIENTGLDTSLSKKGFIAVSSESKDFYNVIKKTKGFTIDEQKAWEILANNDVKLSELKLDNLFRKPYIVGNKYFYLRKDTLSPIAIWEGGFFERGVYVDGKTGQIEIVNSHEKIIQLHKQE